MAVEKLKVELHVNATPLDVGELRLEGKNIHFKYFPEFLKTGLNISPIKLPFNGEIHTANPALFDGLFGVFNDSLPDGWGKLLLDRTLISLGKNPLEINPLERLSYVGDLGTGALVYKPILEINERTLAPINLDVLASESLQIIKGVSSEVLDELYELGGSSGGARPKINVSYNSKTKVFISGSTVLPEGFEHWIIKFPSSTDLPDIAQIEFAYTLMARSCGIEVAEFQLFTGKSGKKYFGTKRFDRAGNRRIHMHSASGIMHDDFRLSQLDYGHLMDCAFKLEQNILGYEKVLRLAAFNVFSHNRDDHSKNFSFLMNQKGGWRFSPAYDLTFSSSSHGHHSTMVAGESKNPNAKNLLELAKAFQVKNAETIISEVKSVIAKWPKFAKTVGVSKASERLISNAIHSMIG